jgi:hypothetical protein
VLTVSRALLQQQEQWLQHGFSSRAGGTPDQAHAVLLLLHNSQLAALAGEGAQLWMFWEAPLNP